VSRNKQKRQPIKSQNSRELLKPISVVFGLSAGFYLNLASFSAAIYTSLFTARVETKTNKKHTRKYTTRKVEKKHKKYLSNK